MNKSATVIVLDVNSSMFHTVASSTHSSTTTALDAAKNAIRLMIQQKLLFSKQDEMGLVLINTAITDNPVHNELPEAYRHIKVHWPLQKPTLQFLESIDNIDSDDASTLNNPADIIDGIIVAMSMIDARVQKLKFVRRIFVITDGNTPINDADDEGLHTIIDNLKRKDYKVNILGVGFQDSSDEAGGGGGNGEMHTNRSDVAIRNEHYLREFAKAVEGACLSVSSALEFLNVFRQRSINQVTRFRGNLEIGTIRIPVFSYGKSDVQEFPTLKRVVNENPNLARRGGGDDEDGGGGGGYQGGEDGQDDDDADPYQQDSEHIHNVKMERTYWDNTGEEKTEVEPDMLIRAYRYGKDFIPIPKEEMLLMKYASEKGLTVLAFAPESQVPNYFFMSNVDCIVAQPNDMVAGRALSAFIHAMYECASVAIVRYVKRKNARPFVGVLHPYISSDYECLYFNQLPFAEDIRDWDFPSFASSTDAQFDDSQLAAAEAFVDTLTVVEEEPPPAGFSEDADLTILTNQETIPSPILQYFYQCVEYRALSGSQTLPEPGPFAQLPIPERSSRGEEVIAEFSRMFPLRVIEKATKEKRHWHDEIALAEAQLFMQKKSGLEGEENAQMNSSENEAKPMTFSSLFSAPIVTISSVTPIEDFLKLLSQRDSPQVIQDAFSQFSRIIEQYIFQSFHTFYNSKSIECLKILREECVRFEESDIFNNLLTSIHAKCGTQRQDFLKLLADTNIYPINTDEVADSKYSTEEAQLFYEKSHDVPMETRREVQVNDTDDIFESLE